MKVNKHALTTKSIEVWIIGFVLVLVLFQVIADIFPDVTTSASALNTSGFPQASFFMSGGVLWYLIAAGLLFLVYKSFISSKK